MNPVTAARGIAAAGVAGLARNAKAEATRPSPACPDGRSGAAVARRAGLRTNPRIRYGPPIGWAPGPSAGGHRHLPSRSFASTPRDRTACGRREKTRRPHEIRRQTPRSRTPRVPRPRGSPVPRRTGGCDEELLFTAFLATIVAVGVTASADQAPVTVGEGEYGCCCAWTEFAGWCPVDFLTFFAGIEEVCFVLDEAGEVTGSASTIPMAPTSVPRPDLARTRRVHQRQLRHRADGRQHGRLLLRDRPDARTGLGVSCGATA
jgi:hypothetical protein